MQILSSKFTAVLLSICCLAGTVGSSEAAELDIAVIGISVQDVVPPATSGIFTRPQNITITYQNNSDINIFPYFFSTRLTVDGTTLPAATPSGGSVSPGGQFTFTYPTAVDLFATGSHSITATIYLDADIDDSNDSLTISVISSPPDASSTIISSFPYSENFESGAGDWTSFAYSTSTAFTLGTPSKTYISGAASGTNAWVTDISSFYSGQTRSQVVSPVFDLRNIQVAEISANVAWELPKSRDGARIDFSTNDGLSWTPVGSSGEPNNWYNSTVSGFSFDSELSAWSGYMTAGSSSTPYTSAGSGPYTTSGSNLGSDGYKLAKHLVEGGSLTRFRVILASPQSANTTLTDEGFAFDDFSVSEAATFKRVATFKSDIAPIGIANAGDVLTITTNIVNSGSISLSALQFADSLSDANLSLIAGSVSTTQGSITTGNTDADSTVMVDLGDIDASDSAQISFDVIVGALSSSVTHVCTLGQISSNDLAISTDDPATAEPFDQTCTAAGLIPTVTPIPTEAPTISPTAIVATPLPTATPAGSLNSSVSAPRFKFKLVRRSLTINVKDSVKGHRDYFVYIVDQSTQKLYKRIRVRMSRGAGKATVRNIPTGNYQAYTFVENANKRIRSGLRKFIIP